MGKNNKPEPEPNYVIKIDCPFCKKTMVTAYDLRELESDDSIDDAERDEVEGTRFFGDDDINEGCEHLAYFSASAFYGDSIGPSIEPKWEKEMTALAKSIWEEENDDPEFLFEDEDADVSEILENAVEYIDDEIVEMIDKVLPSYNCHFDDTFIVKNPTDGSGTAYKLIFLCEKGKV